MTSIFTPAVTLMNRLRYPQKFMLVGLLLLLPLLLVMSQFLIGINADIDFSSKERIGLEYNAPVVDFLQLVQRHSALSGAYLNGDESFQDQLATQQNEIETAINQVDDVDNRLGDTLETTEMWTTIKSDWTALQTNLFTLSPEASADQHRQLITNILLLIIQSGNNSNLILDPDLDSYYLMDTVINKLPLTMDYLGQLRTAGLAVAAKGNLSAEDRSRLVIISGLAESNINANQVGFNFSFETNPDLGDLLPNINQLDIAYNDLSGIIDERILSQTAPEGEAAPVTADAAAFYQDTTPLVDESFALYDAVDPALDTLLENRIDGFVLRRNIVIVVAVIALALTVYLFIGFYLAVQKTIANLDQASQRMISGQMGGGVVLESQDELAQVAVSFNNIASELITARDKALDANRAKSTFLANMSHELRTPLNAILGFAQLMERDKNLNTEQHENVSVIGRSGEHLLALINNVLEMSKIEAGRVTLNTHGFDLHRMIKGLHEMFEVRTEAKSLNLLFELPPEVPRYFKGDESKLRQVLINLLGNAVKFTNEGGIALRVAYDPDLTRLRFEVEDTGEGIEAHELDKLFEAFTQTASGQKSQQDGTGLGLPLSREFVRLMGGDITVSSQVGKGSIFKFSVQAQEVDAAEMQSSERSRRAVGIVEGQPTYRILVVDDKWENRNLLMKLLKSVGFEVAEAPDGQVAIETWEKWEPQLIWMDMRMPVMDGYEATKRIKSTIKGQATVIIALTASAFEHEKSIILSAGCDAFLAKPFREGDIFELMNKHLGIQFIYEDNKQAEQPLPADAKPALSATSLADQPREWLTGLQEAAIQGDAEAVYNLINQIMPQSKALGESLADLVKNYRFDVILNLAEQAGASG